MDYKCAVLFCVLLSAILVQGQHTRNGERCSCSSISKQLDVKRTMKLEIHPPSPKCERQEYIATVKRRKNAKKPGPKRETKCVSGDMKQVKDIIKGKYKKIKVIRHPSKQ